MRRFHSGRRLVLSLSFFGLLPLCGGCTEETSAPAPEVVQQQQKNEADARKKAYGGNTGVPVGKKAMEAASKH